MFKILNTRSAIEKAHKDFATTIQALSTEIAPIKIGYQGGTYDTTALWLSSLGIWAHLGSPPSGKSIGPRYWDVFGIDKPAGLVKIVCEINSPLDGINRRTSGAFGETDEGQLGVLHRGKLHTPGLDSEFFRANYRGKWVLVNDEGWQTEFVLVAMIGAADFGVNLKQFVEEAARIKNLVRSQA
jgi:5-methylcytosine-specific restriction enzyme B